MLQLREFLTLRSPLRLAILSTLTGLLIQPSHQQTYSSCNPTLTSGCPADPALGTSVSVDFTSGASDDNFTPQGSPAVTYDSTNGAAFTVAGQGNAPQVNSKWYIMFGRYEVTMRVAPGDGIVSSIVLESDDLDEIDWEFLGATPTQGQTNYFGKGQTTSYDRGGISTVASDTINTFHTYAVDWTSESIVWSVDGNVMRTLNAADAQGQFPQSPCQFKIGVWSAGDPANAPGTIEWSHGPTDYSAGPFTMYVQSIMVEDYSSGTSYSYSGTSGTWQNIQAEGGSISGNAPSGGQQPTTPVSSSAVTPAPTSGSQAASSPTSYIYPTSTGSSPWGSGPTTTLSSTNYPGLPTGWSVNPSTGKVVPPNGAAGVDVPLRSACVSVLAVIGSLLFGAFL